MRSKDGYDIEIEGEMRGYFEGLSEKDARRFAAIEARKLGHGGIACMRRILGCSAEAIKHGLSELNDLPQDPLGDRIRAVGGGRKKTEIKTPEVKQQISKTLETRTAGDPMQARVTWTDMLPSEIASAVERDFGSKVSSYVVRRLLKTLSFGRRKILKAKTKKSVSDRNLQFEKIASLVESTTSGNPIFSIDTKKKSH